MKRLSVHVRRSILVVVAALLMPVGSAVGQSPDDAARKKKPEPIYDESADAKADIAAAVKKAGKENTRVLVMFGANWCGWCHKLHSVFKSEREIARLLLYEYEHVMVDIGRWDKNIELAKSYGADVKANGVPFLTILDADGKPLANQETGSLEDGPKHDPAKVLAFLKKHVAEPRDAEDVLAAGLKRAKSEGKMLFLHFGAPWCGWCHRLEDFMAREKIAAILERDFIDLKIDHDRMTHGMEVEKRFRGEKTGGIPWFAFLSPDGETLVTADAPERGNVGFPVEPHEIAHFIGMLEKTARNIAPEQIDVIEKALQDSAAEIKARQRG